MRRLAGARGCLVLLDVAHGGDQPLPVEGRGIVGGDHLAVAHDDDAIGIVEHLAEQMRDQDGADAAGIGAAHEGQQLAGRVGIERGGRLVQDDQVQRLVGDGEGARHLDHLAPADRQVANDVGGCDVVARKDLVELGEDQVAGPAAPAEPLQRAMD